jgi:hypothetical protein
MAGRFYCFFLSDDWLPSNLLNLYTDAAAGMATEEVHTEISLQVNFA